MWLSRITSPFVADLYFYETFNTLYNSFCDSIHAFSFKLFMSICFLSLTDLIIFNFAWNYIEVYPWPHLYFTSASICKIFFSSIDFTYFSYYINFNFLIFNLFLLFPLAPFFCTPHFHLHHFSLTMHKKYAKELPSSFVISFNKLQMSCRVLKNLELLFLQHKSSSIRQSMVI